MPHMQRWSDDELLLAFRLYCRMPFGRLHRSNPEILDLAKRIGRTPSAVAMKACNFASLDPQHQKRGVSGLVNISRDDRQLWDRFNADPETVASEAEAVAAVIGWRADDDDKPSFEPPTGPTDEQRTVRVRRVQTFFRAAVLTSYDTRCALTGIGIPGLLNASHIIPWHANETRRADPRNGLCLNTLHDRAFDRGLITFDPELRLVLAIGLKNKIEDDDSEFPRRAFCDLEGTQLRLPERFAPDPIALEHHRLHVFSDSVA